MKKAKATFLPCPPTRYIYTWQALAGIWNSRMKTPILYLWGDHCLAEETQLVHSEAASQVGEATFCHCCPWLFFLFQGCWACWWLLLLHYLKSSVRKLPLQKEKGKKYIKATWIWPERTVCNGSCWGEAERKAKTRLWGRKKRPVPPPTHTLKMPNSEAGRVSGMCHRTEWVKRPWTFRNMKAWDHLKIRYL